MTNYEQFSFEYFCDEILYREKDITFTEWKFIQHSDAAWYWSSRPHLIRGFLPLILSAKSPLLLQAFYEEIEEAVEDYNLEEFWTIYILQHLEEENEQARIY